MTTPSPKKELLFYCPFGPLCRGHPPLSPNARPVRVLKHLGPPGAHACALRRHSPSGCARTTRSTRALPRTGLSTHRGDQLTAAPGPCATSQSVCAPNREGLRALLGFSRPGDRINVLTLDRLGRNMRETLNLVHDLTERGVFLRTLGDKLAVDTSEPGPGTDMAIALLAMFAQMERIYMLERAAGARATKEARGLPTGRPAKLNATTRAGAAQRIKDGAIPEQVAAELGVSRSTLYRELRKYREDATAEPVGQEG
ncbi:recombinase family protein [Streptomyces sp. NPDC055036]